MINFRTIEACDQLDQMIATLKTKGEYAYKDNLFHEAFNQLKSHPERTRILTSLFDLYLSYTFIKKDSDNISGIYNTFFANRKASSILESDTDFFNKLKMLKEQNALVLRARSYWDKYFGLIILLFDHENYQRYSKSRSRKKFFFKWLETIDELPPQIMSCIISGLENHPKFKYVVDQFYSGSGFITIFSEVLEGWIFSVDSIRTPEAHGSGKLRKWTFQIVELDNQLDLSVITMSNNVIGASHGIFDYLFQAMGSDYRTWPRYLEASEFQENS